MSSSSVSNFADKINPFKSKPKPEAVGVAAGEVDRLAFDTNYLAAGGGVRDPAAPKRRAASAGTIVSGEAVEGQIAELTDLYQTRNAFIRARRAAPGLRGATSMRGGPTNGQSLLGNISGGLLT